VKTASSRGSHVQLDCESQAAESDTFILPEGNTVLPFACLTKGAHVSTTENVIEQVYNGHGFPTLPVPVAKYDVA